MEKINRLKIFLCILGAFTIFLSTNSISYAAYCNSPCPNPCTPSRTVCEGTNCTTYCNTASSVSYGTTYYTSPAVSFSYSVPNVRFSISNEIYGAHNYYTRPNIIISNGFRPVYHRAPAPSSHKAPPKPAPKPANKSIHSKGRH